MKGLVKNGCLGVTALTPEGGMERPLDAGHGRWPSLGMGSRGKGSLRGDPPERSAAKSKGAEVGAPGSAWGDPLALLSGYTIIDRGCDLASSDTSEDHGLDR